MTSLRDEQLDDEQGVDPSRRATPRVHLIVPLGSGYGRDMYHGARQAAADLGVRLLVSGGSGGRGMIGRLAGLEAVGSPARSDAMVFAGGDVLEAIGYDRPAVNVSNRGVGLGVPSVIVDDVAIGRVAADHLLDRGCRAVVAVRHVLTGIDRPREDAFARRVVARMPAGPQPIIHTYDSREPRAVPALLADLPRPAGLFAINDGLATRLLDDFADHAIRVPADVALLGADNDELICEAAHPTLSSVDVDAERVGYEAVGVAVAMLAGRPPAERVMRVVPRGVVERESTAVFGTDDPATAKAASYLRGGALRGVTVDQAAAHAGLPRRTFERRFARVAGQTPAQMVQQLRLDHACRLLIDTDWPVMRIAHACGVEHPQHLARLFRERLGTTPSAYRRQLRLRKE